MTEPTKTPEEANPQLEEALRAELNRLGKSFVDVVKVAWESEERRQLEADLKKGLHALAESLEENFKKAGETQQAKELRTKAEETAESVADRLRKSEVAQELGEGLLKGLNALSLQLERLTTDLQTRSQPKATSTDESEQEIPIDQG
jgi:ElaB/YqjD/DUF883 family membrane-anchored ribosome-binding protein